MIIKTEKLGITLLLSLALANFSGCEVFANNSLNQVEVRKNSTDSLQFTLYTSSPYADNVVVTKKSDNRYVILMPNIETTTGAKPDFSAVRDVVSDIDVRTINDGSNGYTKLTVTTNRPIDIKTSTAKSSAPSQSEREYRALISQQQARTTTPATSTQESATNITGFKLPEIQPTQNKIDSSAIAAYTAATVAQNAKPIPQQTTQKTVAQKTSATKNEVKTVAKTTQQQQQAKTAKTTNIVPAVNKKPETKVAQTKIETPVKEVSNKLPEATKAPEQKVEQQKQETKNIEKPIETPIVQFEEPKPSLYETIMGSSFMIAIKNEISSIDCKQIISDIKSKFSGRIPENMPVTLALVLIPLLTVMVLFNLIKGSLQKSQMLKKVLMENMAKRPDEVPSYDNIINDETLSWQEKYQQYREIAKNEEDEMADTTKYSFIAQTPSKGSNVPKQRELYQKGTIPPKTQHIQPQVNANIENLERLLQASPDIEKTEIIEDIEELENETYIPKEVAMEEDTIQEEITRTVKFKGFAEKMVLEESHRNKKVKHRRIQLELPKEKEAPHVNLGYSQLHTNPRSFQGANLSVSDLIAKSNKILKIQPKEEEKIVKDYDMISVDDYLNMIDEDMAKVTSPLSEVVANKLSKIKDKTPVQKTETIQTSSTTTNPITSLRNNTKKDYLNGLIVKSGYNIDAERGFYLVSLEGKSAVIGRIKEEVFVLKKFDKNIDKPLQVRMDNPNVYMVKADDFKSLVEVRKDDMGVLIEL